MKSSATISALTHDLIQRRSIVYLIWADDSSKSLGLTVPFGCPLERVHAEAEIALRALATETAAMQIVVPDMPPR